MARRGNGQQLLLGDLQTGTGAGCGIIRVPIKWDHHIAAVVAAEEKDTDERLVIPRLGEGVKQAETFKGKGCGAKGAKTAVRNACKPTCWT